MKNTKTHYTIFKRNAGVTTNSINSEVCNSVTFSSVIAQYIKEGSKAKTVTCIGIDPYDRKIKLP
jgi:hypothetical protein